MFYTPKDEYVRTFIRETLRGGRVIALNREFLSSSFNNTIKTLEKNFQKRGWFRDIGFIRKTL